VRLPSISGTLRDDWLGAGLRRGVAFCRVWTARADADVARVPIAFVDCSRGNNFDVEKVSRCEGQLEHMYVTKYN
jgi:hypothetical protein